jgi:hypothetical protein
MIEQEYIDRIYNRLSSMDCKLDTDPIEFGPSRLNQKVSEVRGLLSSTEKIFMEVSHNLQKFKRDLLISNTEYTMEQSGLIANDPHVRSGRSQKEREALASTRLVHLQTQINDFTLNVHDLEDLMTVIKAKRTDLKDLQGRLRDQLKLCQEQIALGQRWGSKTHTRATFNQPSDQETQINTLAESFLEDRTRVDQRFNDSVDQELSKALATQPTKQANEILTGSTTNADVVEVFNKLDKVPLDQVDTNNLDEIDLDALFDDFGG